MRKFLLSGLQLDLLLTIAASLATSASLVAFYFLAARLLSLEDFGKFQAVRSVGILLSPIAAFSLAIALPKLMAGEEYKLRLASTGVEIYFVVVIFFATLLISVFSLSLFLEGLLGDLFYNAIVALPLIVGISSTRVLEGMLRGLGRIWLTNLVKGPLNIAIILICLVYLWATKNWKEAILVLGFTYMFSTLVLFPVYMFFKFEMRVDKQTRVNLVKEYLVFGLLRTPAVS